MSEDPLLSRGDETETASVLEEMGGGPTLALVVHDGGATRLERLRVGQTITIGRDAQADLKIEDSQASRQHVRLLIRPACSSSRTSAVEMAPA